MIMRMKILCFKRTAFERQVHESVKIQQNRNHHLLNSRSEFNRCSLPRLTVKLGDRELGELTEKLKEDQKKEDRLEKMISEWKKMSKKRQCCPSSDQPNSKRMRPDDDNDDLADLAIDEAIRNCEEEHQDTGTDKGQAEQPDQAEQRRQKGEETKRAEQMCSDQEQGRENLGQAELMCSDQGLPGDTHTARQTPTTTGAVARYVCFPIGIKSVPILTRLNQGSGPEMDQAEQPN